MFRSPKRRSKGKANETEWLRLSLNVLLYRNGESWWTEFGQSPLLTGARPEGRPHRFRVCYVTRTRVGWSDWKSTSARCEANHEMKKPASVFSWAGSSIARLSALTRRKQTWLDVGTRPIELNENLKWYVFIWQKQRASEQFIGFTFSFILSNALFLTFLFSLYKATHSLFCIMIPKMILNRSPERFPCEKFHFRKTIH